jgi:uncharacterized LabA/DUF88 family protein
MDRMETLLIQLKPRAGMSKSILHSNSDKQKTKKPKNQKTKKTKNQKTKKKQKKTKKTNLIEVD